MIFATLLVTLQQGVARIKNKTTLVLLMKDGVMVEKETEVGITQNWGTMNEKDAPTEGSPTRTQTVIELHNDEKQRELTRESNEKLILIPHWGEYGTLLVTDIFHGGESRYIH